MLGFLFELFFWQFVQVPFYFAIGLADAHRLYCRLPFRWLITRNWRRRKKPRLSARFLARQWNNNGRRYFRNSQIQLSDRLTIRFPVFSEVWWSWWIEFCRTFIRFPRNIIDNLSGSFEAATLMTRVHVSDLRDKLNCQFFFQLLQRNSCECYFFISRVMWLRI